MDQGIIIKVISFAPEWGDSPLPYAPAFNEWTAHVKACAPCARVDQLAQAGMFFDPAELCEGGAVLQLTVTRRIDDQHRVSGWN